jgi:hypothetical protein
MSGIPPASQSVRKDELGIAQDFERQMQAFGHFALIIGGLCAQAEQFRLERRVPGNGGETRRLAGCSRALPGSSPILPAMALLVRPSLNNNRRPFVPRRAC